VVRGDPQNVGLAAGFQELPQVRAGTVDLVPGDEIEAGPVGVRVRADPGGQLPLCPELQPGGSPVFSDRTGVRDLLAGDPLPGADQRVPVPSRT
jgi:hypothetical protein